MLSSLSTLWNLHYLSHPSAAFNDLNRVMLVTEAPLGAFLLVYLNLQQVRRWFSEPEHYRVPRSDSPDGSKVQ